MIKVEVIKEFTLGDFHKLRNIVRKTRNVKGKLFVGDTFECTEGMMKYLTGGNAYKDAFVKVIEIIPEPKIEEEKKEEVKEEPKEVVVEKKSKKNKKRK